MGPPGDGVRDKPYRNGGRLCLSIPYLYAGEGASSVLRECERASVKTALISVNATSSRTTTRNNRYSNNHVNRNDVNSSTVLVFSYRYEHAEDRIPVCRGVCRGVGK